MNLASIKFMSSHYYLLLLLLIIFTIEYLLIFRVRLLYVITLFSMIKLNDYCILSNERQMNNTFSLLTPFSALKCYETADLHRFMSYP